MVDRRHLLDAPERRGIASGQFELRAAGGQLTLTGYASVFDKPYDVMGGAPYGWTETVDQRAFDVTLGAKPDLHLLINHEGMPLARTKSGTLRLATDSTGLHVEAALDPSDPDVQRLNPKMARGDMDEMSFAFRTKRDEWSQDDSQRRLMEVSLHKGDVSVVNFGANPATSAQMNDLGAALEYLSHVDPEEALAELRDGGDGMRPTMARAREVLATLDRSIAPPRRERRTLSLAEALRAQEDGTSLELRDSIPLHHTATANGPWDGTTTRAAAPDDKVVLRYMHAWVDPAGDPEDKKAYRFAHHEGRVGAPANLAAVRNALSQLPQADIPDADRAAVEAHLRAHLNDAAD
jgi:HK97 family phage prohead protease